MELITKRSEGKPPFIGILFPLDQHLKAQRDHQDLFEYWQRCTKPAKPKNTLKIEVHPSYCNMVLHSDGIERHCVHYPKVKCNALDVKNWWERTKGSDSFNFSHLFRQGDTWKVVKTLTGMYSTLIPINVLEIDEGYSEYD